ncbi:putative retrotransposon hot spot (RHS) protein [Trypanosoma conorhini]|uniref:Putative retrotransposon hot spot (RHS) protein n=1 Tax=Trypanosoma conorhini TaxID=83891 RepID=A0A422MU72_9TRYP|nr:putative retrotransposon hot spot (RHS) protein [Trypanosoma conorhini]RNE96743.1 putative retrotransposon hot spot (RHS) protein [Trypanosoma conorhini]
MPEKRARAHAAKKRGRPTTKVLQGRRRARAGPDGNANPPAAQPRREEEAPPQQRPKWTLESRVEEVLMEGEAPAREMLLNDFLREYVGPNNAVDEYDNVPMGVFARRPDEYVTDTELLESIVGLPAYRPYALREELRRLVGKEVVTLRDLRDASSCFYIESRMASKKLRAALEVAKAEAAGREKNERAKRKEESYRRPIPEGFYDSVFNAKWSHVLGYPEGAGEEAAVRMEVREGQAPKRSWEFRASRNFELDNDEVGQFRPPRPTLMVLTSEQGWPHSLREETVTTDCYVNSEMERVWEIVDNDMYEMFPPEDCGPPHVRPHFLLGTYGVGRWVNAGAFILYKLLHYAGYPIRYVVYFLGSELAYVFDKEDKTVEKYEGAEEVKEAVRHLNGDLEERGFAIYDAAEERGPPPSHLDCCGYGMVVVASPNGNNFRRWVSGADFHHPVMSCPSENEVKAMCAWMTRGRPAQEQVDYWETVKQRMRFVGPIPRYIFTEAEFNEHTAAVESALQAIDASVAKDYFARADEKVWGPGNPFHKLVKIELELRDCGGDVIRIAPACDYIEQKLLDRLCEVLTLAEAVAVMWGASRLP